MGLIAKDSGGNFEPAPAGNHIARCYSLIDIGMQHGEYQGKPTAREQIIIGWELPEEIMPHEDGQQGDPFTVSEFFTNTLSEKGKLRPILESWRGRAFTDAELDGFDLTTIVGVPCMVNVVHKPKSGGGVRATVTSVTPLPKSMKCPPAMRPKVIFDCDNPDMELFNSFGDGMKKLIERSDNWRAFQARRGRSGRQQDVGSGSDAEAYGAVDDVPWDDPDDLPF